MPKIYVGRGSALLFEHYHTFFKQSKEKNSLDYYVVTHIEHYRLILFWKTLSIILVMVRKPNGYQ
jgi:hypothetical protein